VSFLSAKELAVPARVGCTPPELDYSRRPDIFVRIYCTNFIFGLCDEAPGGMVW